MRDRDGVVTVQDAGGIGNGLRFRGTLTANYATEKWSVGARARHFSGYYLFYKNLATGEYPVNVNQGSNRIPGATFLDLFGSFQLPTRTEVRAGTPNLFNNKPTTHLTSPKRLAPPVTPRPPTL